MNKKVAFFMSLLMILTCFTYAADKEEPGSLTARHPQKATSVSLNPVSGTPTVLGEVKGTKDFCDLTGTAVYFYSDWFYGQEWYANYQDPEEFGCTDVWPFEVTGIGFEINVDFAMDIEVQGFVFDDTGTLACPVPGPELYATSVTTVSLPAAGYYQIWLPSDFPGFCVWNPYFAVIYIYTDLVGSGADPVCGDDGLVCRSYNDYGYGWVDLVDTYGWPGQMMLYSSGYTNPQNDCAGPAVGCCWWYVDGGPETNCASPVTEEDCVDLGGNFIPDAECNIPTGRCDVPHTVIVEPNDTSIWDKNYFSDTLTIQAVDFQDISKVQYTVFEWNGFDGEDWEIFSIDYDGTTYMQDPWDTLQPGGDGWRGEWVPHDTVPEGYYRIRATMADSAGFATSDTVVQYWDPSPPEATILHPEVFNYPVDPTERPVDILFYTPGDSIREMYITVHPVPDYPGMGKAGSGSDKFDCIQGFNKGVPHIDQHDVYPNGSDGKNRGCSPTSMAACLKYWAGNGFPCLNDNGTMTDAQMVAEIAGFAGTNPNSGTGMKKKKAAIEAYIKKHCGECVFQPVKHLQGKKVTLKRLIKELFEEDEDVITGDYHHVTVVNSFCLHPKKFIDYMDPWTGTEVNGDFDVSKGFDGHPLLELVIVSPKEPVTTTPPPDTIAYPEDITDLGGGMYEYPWYPDSELFPVGRGYFVNVDIIDTLGHKGWDMVKVELFSRGDPNGDGGINVADAVYLINYLFVEGPAPFPLEAGDANCDGVVNIADVVYLMNYLFNNGPAPAC